ncbi:unnamed protein product [Prorocentrum cordatum]|uniref:Uncharacterized protein n=1 Tax=Prorocentrum cordatum TaxID=2364126 RepID=A0ABN9TEH1_9DINO|nr:unnamed protein product [Polarella glacialis]
MVVFWWHGRARLARAARELESSAPEGARAGGRQAGGLAGRGGKARPDESMEDLCASVRCTGSRSVPARSVPVRSTVGFGDRRRSVRAACLQGPGQMPLPTAQFFGPRLRMPLPTVFRAFTV